MAVVIKLGLIQNNMQATYSAENATPGHKGI